MDSERLEAVEAGGGCGGWRRLWLEAEAVEVGGCGGWKLWLEAEAMEAGGGCGWRLWLEAVEAVEVDSGSICSGNALVQSTHPGPQPHLQGTA